MRRFSALFLGIFALLGTTAFAQNKSTDNGKGPFASTRLSSLEADMARYIFAADDGEDAKPDPITRPRVVKRTSGVAAAHVVVATVLVERAAFDLINQKRAENGLRALTWSNDLAAVARLHSRNMAELSFFSHRGLDSKMVSDRADDLNVGRWRAIGENIAFMRGDGNPASRAVDLWLGSQAHRHNLLDDGWKESAIGVAVAEDGAYYFTQVFLVRK
jgi:uncharacterized protein YkwD